MNVRSHVIPLGLAVILVLAFGYLGGTVQMGAHPFWSVQVIHIGFAVGAAFLIFAHFLGLSKARKTLVFGLGLAIAAGMTRYGKIGFVASYAEDWFAGKLWYYGWIATCAMSFCFLVSVFSKRTN